MRLDKFLADAGIGTRSEVKTAIRKRFVSVNGTLAKDPGMAVCETDMVLYKDQPVNTAKTGYFLMNKPSGCVCANKDDSKTVFDLMSMQDRKGLFTVGRLDKDTEGLLLLTDDGAFAHALTSPRRHVNKTYYFEGEGCLVEQAVAKAEEGIDIGDDKLTEPAKLVILTASPESKTVTGELTISEGRFHQVKRMMKKLGVTITYLKRLSIGDLCLDPNLLPGQYRPMTEEELALLQPERKKT
nr:rRNA pseudouridine synthase [Lachnospiraceae bacterium]